LVTGQKPPDNKPSRIITKNAVDANLFRLGNINPKKKNPAPGFFFGFYTGGFCPGSFCRGAFDLEPYF